MSRKLGAIQESELADAGRDLANLFRGMDLRIARVRLEPVEVSLGDLEVSYQPARREVPALSTITSTLNAISVDDPTTNSAAMQRSRIGAGLRPETKGIQ